MVFQRDLISHVNPKHTKTQRKIDLMCRSASKTLDHPGIVQLNLTGNQTDSSPQPQ